ncbi:MAG: hypothetical protein ACRBN8_32770 [Nannocystales bacterium]
MRRWLLPVALGVGCSSAVDTEPTETSSSGSDGSTSAQSATSAPSTSASSGEDTTTGLPDNEGTTTSPIGWETEGADEGYATTGGCGFTCPQPPGPSGSECDFSEQGCGEDGKCMPWANDGGRVWTGVRCVPLDPNAVGLGEPCQAEGGFVSGIDNCATGLWCGPENADDKLDLTGVCHQICNAGPCLEGTLCVIPGEPDVGVCEEQCDPLAPACPAGHTCMPAIGIGFACHLAELEGTDGDCDAHAECEPGYGCLDAPQCGGDGERCCTQLCDLDAPACAKGETCVDYGSPLPAYDAVGFCAG